MRRSVIAVLLGFLVACGNSNAGSPDASGGDDQPGDDSGNGGGNTPHTVKLTLTNRPMNADNFSFLVAYQDGAAPWKLAPAPSGDTYTFTVNAPSYGVAFTCISAASATTTTQPRSVTAAYFAVGERTELTLAVPDRCTDRNSGQGTIMLGGSVTNRPSGTLVVVWGGRSAFVGAQSGNFQLTAAPGTHDLFVVHVVPEGNGDFYTDEAWVARGVTLNSNGNRIIDFSEAQQTSTYGVDVGPLDVGTRATAMTTLYTANGSQAQLVRENANWGTVALADAQMQTTDVYEQSIQVTSTGKSATLSEATNDPIDQTFTAPPPLGPVQSSVLAKMPYIELQATWPAYASSVGYTWVATQQLSGSQCGSNGNSSSCSVTWQAYLSPGVTGAMPAFAMPDLSSLAGWKPALQFVAGATPVAGGVTAQTSSAGAADFPAGVPANGTTRTFVRSDFLTSLQ